MTTIVNVSNGDECDIYCGRPSKWGNQFRIGMLYQGRKLSRADAIAAHRDWFLYSTDGYKLQQDIEELRDLRLGCHCAPLDCHCQTYVDFLSTKPRLVAGVAPSGARIPLRRLRH